VPADRDLGVAVPGSSKLLLSVPHLGSLRALCILEAAEATAAASKDRNDDGDCHQRTPSHERHALLAGSEQCDNPRVGDEMVFSVTGVQVHLPRVGERHPVLIDLDERPAISWVFKDNLVVEKLGLAGLRDPCAIRISELKLAEVLVINSLLAIFSSDSASFLPLQSM